MGGGEDMATVVDEETGGEEIMHDATRRVPL
jgi:hypothetical protein